MKKSFKIYIICWAIVLALFNVVAFVTPAAPGCDKFAPSFWIGYAGITVALIGDLICGYFTFKAENAQKFFYRIPLLTLSYAAVIVTFIFGGICMLISAIPYWVGLIVSCVILALYAIAVLGASAAAGIVADTDNKIKTKTFFIKSMTVAAETLLASAKTDEKKEACKKVYEAVRYSDPMSNEALAGVENQIALKYNEFSNAVTRGNSNVSAIADELVVMLDNRNKRCKLLK